MSSFSGAGVAYDYDIKYNFSQEQLQELASLVSSAKCNIPEYLAQAGADKDWDKSHRNLKAHRKETLHRSPSQNGSELTAWVAG